MADRKYNGYNVYTNEKGEAVTDAADSYAENPTPQARYAINKLNNEQTPYAFVNDVKEAQKKGRGPMMQVINDYKEKMAKAGREADNEMKREGSRAETMKAVNNKKGGKVCGMKKGGAVKARGCGCAQRGLTKGEMR